MLLTAIVFIVILGTLVLVHELGHFLVAKRNGVPSEEFGFGFPPRLIGTYKDVNGKRRWVLGGKKVDKKIKDPEETIYSLNLIPIGGFVKIKGEDGQHKDDPRSFAAQSVWVRFKVLFAGVGMNFVLAVVLFYFAFLIGLPEEVGDDTAIENSRVQIAQVVSGAPAAEAGIAMGDEIISIFENDKEVMISSVSVLQEVVDKNKGKEIKLKALHAGEDDPVLLTITPRADAPEGQGPLGIEIVQTAFVRHGPIESLWLALERTVSIILAIFAFLWDLILKLFSAEKAATDVAGPVGIAVMTGQVARMGFAFVLHFAALLSVNLAVINLLPIPALDGGRILFLLIEKIKGSPVSEKVEGLVHTVGFFVLISLMILVTVKDFANFQIFDKFKGLFGG